MRLTKKKVLVERTKRALNFKFTNEYFSLYPSMERFSTQSGGEHREYSFSESMDKRFFPLQASLTTLHLPHSLIYAISLTVSRVSLIGVLPFHHVTVGAGLEPTTSHHSSQECPADNARFSPWSFTHSGRTVEDNLIYSQLEVKNYYSSQLVTQELCN